MGLLDLIFGKGGLTDPLLQQISGILMDLDKTLDGIDLQIKRVKQLPDDSFKKTRSRKDILKELEEQRLEVYSDLKNKITKLLKNF
ncbi:MAG: hypothetical protein AABW58_02395 [Nanoarchaeota archaeon]